MQDVCDHTHGRRLAIGPRDADDREAARGESVACSSEECLASVPEQSQGVPVGEEALQQY